MPCMSYEPDFLPNDTNKDLRDKLARIACKAMTELERIDPTNKLFSDKEAGPWFTQHKIDDAKAKEAERGRRDKARKAKEARALALSKLTEEDKKALGLSGKNR